VNERIDPTAGTDPDDRFDAFARSAGAELRRPAPADGVAAVRATRRRQQRTRAALAGTAAVVIIAGGAAIALRDEPPAVTVQPDPTSPATVVTAPPETVAPTVTDGPTTPSPASNPTTTPATPPTVPATPSTAAPASSPELPVGPSADETAWRDERRSEGYGSVVSLAADGTDARLLVAQLRDDGQIASAVLLADGRVVDLPAEANPGLFELYGLGGRPALLDLGPDGDGGPMTVWVLDATGDWSESADLGLGQLDGSVGYTVLPYGVTSVDDVLLVTVEEYQDLGDGSLAVSPNRRGVIVDPDLSVTRMAQSPDGVPMSFSSSAGGRALALFGPNLGSLGTPPFSQPWAFDPNTNAWSEIALPDWFRCTPGGFDCDWWESFDGGPTFELVTERGVLANVPDGSVGLYDPVADTWTRADAPFTIGGFWASATTGTDVVVAPGRSTDEVGSIGVLDLATTTWSTIQVDLSADVRARIDDQWTDFRWDLRTWGRAGDGGARTSDGREPARPGRGLRRHDRPVGRSNRGRHRCVATAVDHVGRLTPHTVPAGVPGREGASRTLAGMAELFLGGNVDPATHERTGAEVRIDTDAFTTHGVIVGMTGSGKTGLGVVLIEEVLAAGLPALLIDPKGDLTNLCLTFPSLQPADFRPWIDDAQARAAGLGPDEFAAQQAETWTKGLLGWGKTAGDIAQLRAATDFTIYTPGSQSGVPVNIVGSLQVPADMSDAEVVGDEIEGYVSGLLGLVGIAADPLSSREHILLSNLVHHAWSEGRSLDLAALVGMVGNPPIRKLGVFELDQFFPAGDRMALAMQLNGLLASPSFAAWGAGPALDISSMLYTPEGKGRCAIVTTAHLSDDERQFVTSLVLSKLVTWMRRQSGTTDLRALLYMDEVAGYLPPTANPPTKKPIMTLMKQARAFGVGVVLSTQNPVDVDYKALSNAGTWMIGRLQTERDKARLLDGLASAAGAVDVPAVDATISRARQA
jgi:hypothetical protein